MSSSSSESSIDSSSSSSSGRTVVQAGDTITISSTTEIEYVGGSGTTATVILLGEPFSYVVANIGGSFVWDYLGDNEVKFTEVGQSVESIGEQEVFSITYDGVGSLLFTIADTGLMVPEAPLVAMASRSYGEGRVVIHTDRIGGYQTGHGANRSSLWRGVLEWTSGKLPYENINVGLLINTESNSIDRIDSFDPISVQRIDLPYMGTQDLSSFDCLYVVGLPDEVADIVTDKVATFVANGGGLVIEYPDRGREVINMLRGIEDVYCYSDERIIQSLAYWTLTGSQSYVFEDDASISFMSSLRQVDFSSEWAILMSSVETDVTTTTTTSAEEQAPDLAKASGSEFGISYISAMQDGVVELEENIGTSSSSSDESESSSSSSSIDSSSTSSEQTYIDICSDIIAQWKMNDNTDTSMVQVEDNNYSHTGAYNSLVGLRNTEDRSVVGITNRALEFDSALEEYVETPPNTSLNFSDGVSDSPFSISLWIYPTTVQGGFMAVKDNCYQVYFRNTDQVAVDLEYGSNTFTAYTSKHIVDTDQWYHIVATYDGRGNAGANDPNDGVEIYVDAAKESPLNLTGGGPTPTFMNNDDSVFYISNTTSPNFDGRIDNIMIFDRVLSAREIEFLWNRGNGTEECEGIHWNTSSSSNSSASSDSSSSDSSSSSSSSLSSSSSSSSKDSSSSSSSQSSESSSSSSQSSESSSSSSLSSESSSSSSL